MYISICISACIFTRRTGRDLVRYLNQVGRAGRDGRPSVCRLCWSGADAIRGFRV